MLTDDGIGVLASFEPPPYTRQRQCRARLVQVAAVRIAGPPMVRRDQTIRHWTNLARDMYAVWERDGEQAPHAPCRQPGPCAI
jgi:hypothetical protein